MAQPYIRLDDFQPHQPDPTPGETDPSNNPNPIDGTNDTQFFGFTKHNLVLLCKTFARCLATTIFIAFILATFKIYENKKNFTSRQKTNFNIIVTALSLCLGLNFFVSHKIMTKGIHRYYSLTHSIAGLIQRPSKRLPMENSRSIQAPSSRRLDISH